MLDKMKVNHKPKFCLHKVFKTLMLAIPATKTGILRFCVLEKRTQCRKLESLNKLVLIDYL